jgi:O-acetyl-ADP-ribose deacetylase (regulator of RNase III)
MTIQYRRGNAVTALIECEVDVLLHVCNNKGVMGSGIALEIKNRIPDAYESYKYVHEKFGLELGSTSYGVLEDENADVLVINMIAQDGYGSGKRFLNYGALAQCLHAVSLDMTVEKIGLPYKMGADRAGGDWTIVLEMIEFYLKDFDVTIYELESV